MRKVECKVWNPDERKTNKIVHGVFHMWSQDYEEFENGPGNFPVAVVELEDGTVITPHVTYVKFIEEKE